MRQPIFSMMNKTRRNEPLIEKILSELDLTLRTLFPAPQRFCARPNPGLNFNDDNFVAHNKLTVGKLMRVNHAGEICAQALYQGHSLTAQNQSIKKQMADAAADEVDHLAWCEQRLAELNTNRSLCNPLWYAGSLLIGMAAGLAGDRWSLAFVAETEKQVSAHLADHLTKIPTNDHKTIAIVKQMQADETKHAKDAHNAGAADLPLFIKKIMQTTAKIMTITSYYL